MGAFRDNYYKRLRKKLNISYTPTIIASDCLGTFMYHNLGLQFCSPTINLFFTKDDFMTFVQNLSGFLDAELTEAEDKSVSYPVGSLEYNGEIIRINFMHSKTFDEAKNHWNERKERMDYSHIFIVQLIDNGVTEEDINRFDSLPFENKMLITDKNLTNSKNVVTHKILNRKDYFPAKIMSFKSHLSCKRYMDDIDYVSFFNAGK